MEGNGGDTSVEVSASRKYLCNNPSAGDKEHPESRFSSPPHSSQFCHLGRKGAFRGAGRSPDCGLLGMWWEMTDSPGLQGACQRDSD